MPTKRNLSQWLTWLEAKQPDHIELGLQRIAQVAENAGLLQPACRVITVAGTNGKGSTVGYIAAVLANSGLRVGVYTSPHFQHYSERIVVDDQPISDAELVAAFGRIEDALDDISLTYFEFTTLTAMAHFEQCQVDVAVLEVGLGGRLDAVNLWDSEVACVTSVSIDHTDWLGNDRESIGREKAGVARAGRPLVCGDLQPPDSLLQHARQIGAPLHRRGHDFDFGDHTGWQFNGAGMTLQLSAPSIAADWAQANAAVAMTACALFLDRQLSAEAATRALQSVSIAGRVQQLSHRGVPVLLDVAHNPAAAQALAGFIEQHPVRGVTRAVFGCMQDKEVHAVLAPLATRIDQWHLGSVDSARAMSTADLAGVLGEASAPAETLIYPSVTVAFDQAVAQSESADRVLVFGSFLVVAAVLQLLDSEPPDCGATEPGADDSAR